MRDDTVKKLRSMKLSVMAENYLEQLANPNNDLRNFEERFEEIVSAEWESRYNKKMNRYLKQAQLKYPSADFDEKLYEPDRLLDTETIMALTQLTWVNDARNILITGSTGAGKTWCANALCICAIRKFMSVRYIKTSALINELEKAEIEKNYQDILGKYAKFDILAIDDFGLMELDIDKCRNLFEVIDAREGRKPTVVISQLPVSSWYELFKDNTYADACMDRLIHKAYRIEMNGTNLRNPSK